eukprot:TRINITY_DN1563_c0_g1_i10.p1 TRINITY_DN1563_c0_g1~~TRINITY_DN1563_c0_g1_i10.p1  ORF type:complete len:220 (+),score=25.12 TRINITY_DN1563_c0_g1_i10:128-787(+)
MQQFFTTRSCKQLICPLQNFVSSRVSAQRNITTPKKSFPFRLALPSTSAEPKSYKNRVSIVRAGADVGVEEKGKLLTRLEISPMIPRDDLMDQLYKWATSEVIQDGYRTFGMHCELEEGDYQGYTVWMKRRDERVAGIMLCYDNEVLKKYEWIGRGDSGMPQPQGGTEDIEGKHLEVWKIDSHPVDDEIRSGIKTFCQLLVNALNRYYAFGSVFSEEGG